MKREAEVRTYKDLVMISADLSEDKLASVKWRLGALISFLERELSLEDDGLKIRLGIPVCICEDGRGWSTCGASCLIHRPHYFCTCGGCGNCVLIGSHQGCSKRVAYMKTCVRCSPKEVVK